MKHWQDPQPVNVPANLRDTLGGHPLVAQTLVRRGITELERARAFLDPDAYQPASPDDLPEMDRAVERLKRALQQGETIGIWGDFDVDGQTATSLLVAALRAQGGKVVHHIPNRHREGHGVNVPRLRDFLDGGVELVVTCDTGIAAHEAIAYAKQRQIDVIITDHHHLPDTLPEALARVNPKRLPEGHPLRELPGVGVAYLLMQALGVADIERHLDLVALGIVADVASQVGDTRYLLQRGLDVLRETTRPGLRAMFALADIQPAEIDEQHIGFALGPRLNALGRLDDANPAVDLLTSSDESHVTILAQQLERLNSERKLLSQQVYDGAKSLLEKDPALLEHAALVLHHPSWHTGVVGIVANRLVEEYDRPAILLRSAEGIARGSARSVDGVDITAAISAHAEMLHGYGGHTMAAGLSLDEAQIPVFRRALARTVAAWRGAALTQEPTLAIDAYLSLPELTLSLVRDLTRLAPFGAGNPPLTLATRALRLRQRRAMGRRGEHLRLVVEDAEGHAQNVIWWRGDADDLPPGRFDLAYTLRESTYKGEREVLVEWLDARPLAGETVTLHEPASSISYEDLRHLPETMARIRLKHLRDKHPAALIWGEAIPDAAELGAVDRRKLDTTETLIVWTVPPGRDVWEAVLEGVQPQQVIAFAQLPPVDALEPFLRRLLGLLKTVVNRRGGETRLSDLAAAMAHRERTVRVALDWLREAGQLELVLDEDAIQVTRLTSPAPGAPEPDALRAHLAETAAYRAHWRRMRLT